VTGAEVLLRLEDLGARFALAADGTIRAELPDPEPAAVPLFLAELKARREEAIRFLQARRSASPESGAHRSCCCCEAPLDVETDLLCPKCFSARRGPGRVLPFDPEHRRRRTIARLAERRCGHCGTTNWLVTERGDAVCQTCASARREEP